MVRLFAGGALVSEAVLLTAAEWARMMRQPLLDRRYRQTQAGRHVEAFLDYKRLARRSERTLDQYERDIARQFVLNPEKTLEEFTSEDMLAVLASFPQGSQRRASAALSEFWKWAYLWLRIPENPMLRVPTIPRDPPQVVEIFHDADEGVLCAVSELRDRALMLILFGAGIRDGEARLLRLQDVDLDERKLHVKGKGRKERLIPLPRRVVEAVAELAVLDGLDEDNFLWYRQKANAHARRVLRERPIVYSGFHRWWKRTLDQADVAYKNPHTTRHTYATKYLRAGGRLSRILGHSSVAVTEAYYAHLDLTDLVEDADADLVMAVRRWEEAS